MGFLQIRSQILLNVFLKLKLYVSTDGGTASDGDDQEGHHDNNDDGDNDDDE